MPLALTPVATLLGFSFFFFLVFHCVVCKNVCCTSLLFKYSDLSKDVPFCAFISINAFACVCELYFEIHKMWRGSEYAVRQDQTVKCLEEKWRQTTENQYTSICSETASSRNWRLGSSVDKIDFVAQENITKLNFSVCFLLLQKCICSHEMHKCKYSRRNAILHWFVSMRSWSASLLVTAFEERHGLNMVQRRVLMRRWGYCSWAIYLEKI